MGKPNQKRKQRNRSEHEQNDEKKIKTMEQEAEDCEREEIISDDAVREDDSQEGIHPKVQLWMQEQQPYLESGYDEIEEYITEENDAPSQVLPEDTEILLRERLKNYSEEEKCQSVKYECEWKKCQYLSGNDRKYFLHVEQHATEAIANDEGSYGCAWDLCDFVAKGMDELMGHVHYHGYHTKLKVHGASLTFLLKIPACSYDSRTRNTISTRPTSFSCEWDGCGQRFNKAMHFFHHVDTHIFDLFTPGVKSAKEPQRCLWPVCNESFRERWKAVRHINAHTGRRALACYNCGEMFRERCKYLDHCHRQIELADRKYQCPECDRFYATQRLLKAHLAKHTKSAQCTLCPLSFPSMATLSRHILTRHIKDRPFACNQCSYRSVTKYELEKHHQTHSTKNVYRCSEFGCNVVYKSESSIKRHISMHYNRPVHYECHICSKSYKIGWSLSKHLATVHKVERLYGHTRFRYKIDTDGVFRMASYIDERDKKSGMANVSQECGSTSPPGCTVEEVSQETQREKNPLVNGASKLGNVKPTISTITQKGNTFIVELALQPDTEAADTNGSEPVQANEPLYDTLSKEEKNQAASSLLETESMKQEDGSQSSEVKLVQDFTVMRRYLKFSKMPKINGKSGD
ncbi:histone H4 transcription factor-like [Anopheles aquasalis]|uniref:histone H4 transcription factor-like n=1 Tax=Anopheles aquasalis TaxID=42839 RepID=UPI00215A7093|nr:histone H4 transcription factor-like [Anopheles aquasalis]